jgi:hypothetical protein
VPEPLPGRVRRFLAEDGIVGKGQAQVMADHRIRREIALRHRRPVGLAGAADRALHAQRSGPRFARRADGDGDLVGIGVVVHGAEHMR